MSRSVTVPELWLRACPTAAVEVEDHPDQMDPWPDLVDLSFATAWRGGA
jgi:hypothetical protein